LEGKKTYQKTKSAILNVINDIVELQNAKLTFSDTPNGKIHFIVKMYGYKWEYQFSVTETGNSQCGVTIKIERETLGAENQIKREFALIDSMLNEDRQFELIA
jgi:hypothetical protein